MKNLAKLLCVLTLLTSSFAFADGQVVPTTMRLEPAFKLQKNPNDLATMIGFGVASYQSENFFVGGKVYTGQVSQGGVGNFTEGGLSAGVSYPWTSGMNFIGELLLGAGGATLSTTSQNGAGFLASPAIGVDLGLGRNIRAVALIGYDYIPSASNFTGWTVEIRADFLN